MAPTMKEAFVTPKLAVEIRDVPIPRPPPGNVLIKVAVAGMNPKDWKVPVIFNKTLDSCDDIAGTIAAVGEGVLEFHVGDRVAGFHQAPGGNGAYAEYAISPARTTFHIPPGLSFEDASTLPLAALTAGVGLFQTLELPGPWIESNEPVRMSGLIAVPELVESAVNPAGHPLLVYGAGTAVGAFAIKLAKAAGVGPIVAVAGGSAGGFVNGLLDTENRDQVVDYRKAKTPDELAVLIREAVKKTGAPGGVKHAVLAVYDTPDDKAMMDSIARGLKTEGDDRKDGTIPRIASVMPAIVYAGPEDAPVDVRGFSVATVHLGTERERTFGLIFSRYLTKALQMGWLSPHPVEVVERGLEGIQEALGKLRRGEVSAFKFAVRIADTPGIKG